MAALTCLARPPAGYLPILPTITRVAATAAVISILSHMVCLLFSIRYEAGWAWRPCALLAQGVE